MRDTLRRSKWRFLQICTKGYGNYLQMPNGTIFLLFLKFLHNGHTWVGEEDIFDPSISSVQKVPSMEHFVLKNPFEL